MDLDEVNNADLVEPLWRSLPYRTLQGHALVAGDCLYHVPPAHGLVQAVPDRRVDRQAAPNGTVFCSAVQHLTIKYGALTEPMPAAPIGRVWDSDLPVLRQVGQAVWDSLHGRGEPIIAEVCRLDQPAGHDVYQHPCISERAASLVATIAEMSKSVLVEPPDELVRLHQGHRMSDAGSRGSVLTTLVFVNGETRPLGYMTYTALARAAKQTDISLDSLREMARMLLVKPSEFLGYCGLSPLWAATEEVVDILSRDIERLDFVALMEQMALYVNALGAWNLQLFPWELAPQQWTYRSMREAPAHV
ncbi:hypothetical protein [Micromonospora fulviviridis]|uniref:cucumopine synthase-related protein n=1 Tax=Micromonospora fulviviridis TaxID=47860 RepID=UPI0037894440